jgi:hypothetical protein
MPPSTRRAAEWLRGLRQGFATTAREGRGADGRGGEPLHLHGSSRYPAVPEGPGPNSG